MKRIFFPEIITMVTSGIILKMNTQKKEVRCPKTTQKT